VNTLSPPNQIRKLNSLRGFAAMVVVVAHFSGATGWLDGLPGLGAGQLGVMVFFVLSGFLMGHLYLARSPSMSQIWRYAVARGARVLPLFAMVLALSIVLPRLGIRGVFFDLIGNAEIASHVLLLSGRNILWTIPTELHFYALFIVFWLAVARSRRFGVTVIVTVAAAVILAGFPRPSGEVFRIPFELRVVQTIPYFLAGVAIGLVYRSDRRPIPQSAFFAASLGVIPLMYPLIFERIFGFRHGLWNDPLVLGVVVAVFLLILFGVPDQSRVLSNSVGDFLGRISYSLYLLHVPIMTGVRRLGLTGTVGFVVFASLSIVVAFAVYTTIEVPAQRLLRKRLLRERV